MESSKKPTAKISAKSVDWMPRYGPSIFATFQNVALFIQSTKCAKIPYLSNQMADLAEILAEGLFLDSITTL